MTKRSGLFHRPQIEHFLRAGGHINRPQFTFSRIDRNWTKLGRLAVSLARGVALQVDKNGTILAIGHTNETGLHGGTGLYSIDKITGVANFEGDTEIDRAMDMALRSDGTLWAVGGPISETDETKRGNILYQIDPEDGRQLSDIPIMGTEGVEVMGIMFDASDNLFASGFAENGPLYQLDEETGMATSLGDTFNRPHGGDIFIPEPSSLLLACFGFLALIRWRKRSG